MNIKKGLSTFMVAMMLMSTLVGLINISEVSKGVDTSLPFVDDFEDGNPDGWQIVNPWYVNGVSTGSLSIILGSLTGIGNYLLRVDVPNDGTNKDDHGIVLLNSTSSTDWSNYVYEIDGNLQITSGSYGYIDYYFYSQSKDNVYNSYWLRFAKLQDWIQLNKIVNGISSNLVQIAYPVDADTVYSLKVALENGNIKVFVNDNLKIDVNDSTFNKGTVGFGVATAGLESVLGYFDNVVVSGTSPMVPSVPQNLQISSGDSYVDLSWNAPLNDGGSPITEYRIYRGTYSGGEAYLDSVDGSSTSYHDTGVTNGETYYYYVTAVNDVGESELSSEVSVKAQISIVYQKILGWDVHRDAYSFENPGTEWS